MNLHLTDQDARIVIDALRREHEYIVEVADLDAPRANRIREILLSLGAHPQPDEIQYEAAGEEFDE